MIWLTSSSRCTGWFYVSLTQVELFGKKKLVEVVSLPDWSVYKPMGIFLIDCCGKPQPIVFGATLRQVVLGSKRKQAEQAMKSKPVSGSSVSASVPAFIFMPLVPVLISLHGAR